MQPRLAEEWADIVAAYPDAELLTNPERLQLTLELDARLYSVNETQLAVAIPAGYPAVGPDGFFVRIGLQMTDGSLPAGDATGVGMAGWLLVSFHLIDGEGRSTWHPTSDARRGDNLVGYVASIESFLARSCN